MGSVFVLIDARSTADAALQLALTLPREGVELRVGLLGGHGPVVEAFRAAEIPFLQIPFRHTVDLASYRQVRRAFGESNAAVLHAVGPLAVRVSALLRCSRLLVSGAACGDGFLRWISDWKTRAAHRVLAYSNREFGEYRQHGVAESQIVPMPLTVAPLPPTADGDAFRRSLGIPLGSRLILCAGPLEQETGIRDAIWAFDGLKYESPDLYLVVVGEGSERERLEEFGKALGVADVRIRFAGARPDLPALLPLAEVVWVTSMRGGMSLAGCAMAAGRPVVAWKGSEASERLRDGETGRLIPRDDRITLASKTLALLEEAEVARQIGLAGQAVASQWKTHPAQDVLLEIYSEG